MFTVKLTTTIKVVVKMNTFPVKEFVATNSKLKLFRNIMRINCSTTLLL